MHYKELILVSNRATKFSKKKLCIVYRSVSSHVNQREKFNQVLLLVS